MRILTANAPYAYVAGTRQKLSVQECTHGRFRKKTANVSISADLLQQVRALKIDLSATLESALLQTVRERKRMLWEAERQLTIAAYNTVVEARGVFSDGLRSF